MKTPPTVDGILFSPEFRPKLEGLFSHKRFRLDSSNISYPWVIHYQGNSEGIPKRHYFFQAAKIEKLVKFHTLDLCLWAFGTGFEHCFNGSAKRGRRF